MMTNLLIISFTMLVIGLYFRDMYSSNQNSKSKNKYTSNDDEFSMGKSKNKNKNPASESGFFNSKKTISHELLVKYCVS